MRGAKENLASSDRWRAESAALLASLRTQMQCISENVPAIDLSEAIVAHKEVTSDHHIWEDIDERQSLYVLDDGFAYRFAHLTGGKRHIDDIFGPGAICNWPRVSARDYRCNMLFKAGSRIVVLDPARTAEILGRSEEVTRCIQRLELARSLRMAQRVRALISLPASHRITIFLLDVREEYRMSGRTDDWVPLTVTQEEIADVTGMTEVHVNRTLAKMEHAGELARRRGEFCLPNSDRLEEQLDYRRFLNGYDSE